jgi:hypothetical protein
MIRADHIIIENIITLVLITLTFIYRAGVKAEGPIRRPERGE